MPDTAAGATIARAAFLEGMHLDPEVTVSEWADQHRILPRASAAEPGEWRTERTPYLREVMDRLSTNDATEVIVLMKGAQIGGTECGNNWLGYVVHHAPAPMLFVQPTVDMAKRTSKQRIGPMIEACPALRERIPPARSRDSGNTLLTKEFPGGLLVITGANSAVGLRSMPVKDLFLDEVDGYVSDVDGEGDPVELAMRRTATYSRNRKVLIVSTPTTRGISRIERAFERSTKSYYHVPCPYCRKAQVILWRGLKWTKGKPGSVALQCEHCGKLIPEHRKEWMLPRGTWMPTARSDIAGYHLSALYSPLGWYSWEDAVLDFLKSKEHGPEALKTWTNTVLGETWEEEGETLNDEFLFARREEYSHEVPEGGLILTAGVDVQVDRLEMEVVAWGGGEETWAVDYRVLWGDPGDKRVWKLLDEALDISYEHANGTRLRSQVICVDSGHATQQVYEYVRKRQPRGVYAIKGMPGKGRPIVSAGRRTKSGKAGGAITLFLVGVDEAKALLYSRLRLTEPGRGFCHFPVHPQFDPEHFAQLTAEKKVVRYRRGFPYHEWVQVYGRNEALDCRVYAMAAFYILNPAMEVVARRMKAAGKKPPAKRGRKERKSGFVHRWKR